MLVLQLCSIQIYWISMQNEVMFIGLLQVGAISLQYSYDDVIGIINLSQIFIVLLELKLQYVSAVA